MRQMLTFYLLLATFLLNAQKENLSAEKKQDSTGIPGHSPSIRLRCAPSTQNTNVLYVIDGVLAEGKEIEKLDPEKIESIDVLKDSAAKAIFCWRRYAEVVIITTKKARVRTFSIIDQLDVKPIPAATVQFISSNHKDTLMITANDQGMFETDQLEVSKDYLLKVSSVGYKTTTIAYNTSFEKIRLVIKLDRDVKMNAGVIVKGEGYSCRRCGGGCRVGVIWHKAYAANVDSQITSAFKLYPNPATRNSSIIVDLDSSPGKGRQLSLFTIHGQRIHTQTIPKGQSRIQIPVSSQWTAGVYLVQLVNEKGVISKQEKIIIQ